MSKSFDVVCTNPKCDYSDNMTNPNQKGLTQDAPFGTCPKCEWPLIQRGT